MPRDSSVTALPAPDRPWVPVGHDRLLMTWSGGIYAARFSAAPCLAQQLPRRSYSGTACAGGCKGRQAVALRRYSCRSDQHLPYTSRAPTDMVAASTQARPHSWWLGAGNISWRRDGARTPSEVVAFGGDSLAPGNSPAGQRATPSHVARAVVDAGQGVGGSRKRLRCGSKPGQAPCASAK